MPPKRKQLKTYAFIDTNIFLDFYQCNNDTSLSLLRKLESVKDRIICTYQVEMEFLKNRQKIIIKHCTKSSRSIDAGLPAVMGDSNLNKALKKEKKEIEKRNKELRKRVINIIKTPSSYDPIYKSLESIFSSNDAHVLTRNMKIRHKIKRLAYRRFMLGYPPRKAKDTSIGDALNWEWFVHCCKKLKGKFIIVSRDTDYGAEYNGQTFLNDALKSEFRDRVGQKPIIYTTKLSEALKLLEVSVTQAEEQSEADQMLTSTLDTSHYLSGDSVQLANLYSKHQDIIKNIQPQANEVYQRIFEQNIRLNELFSNNDVLEKFREQQEIYTRNLLKRSGEK